MSPPDHDEKKHRHFALAAYRRIIPQLRGQNSRIPDRMMRVAFRVVGGVLGAIVAGEGVLAIARWVAPQHAEIAGLLGFGIVFLNGPSPYASNVEAPARGDAHVALESKGLPLLTDTGRFELQDGRLVFEGSRLSFALGRASVGRSASRAGNALYLYPQGFPEASALRFDGPDVPSLFDAWSKAPPVPSRALVPFSAEPLTPNLAGLIHVPLLYALSGALIGTWLQARLGIDTEGQAPFIGAASGAFIGFACALLDLFRVAWENRRLRAAGF